MRIAVLGCDETTYEFLRGNNGLKCEKPLALGWIGAFLFFFIVIFGSCTFNPSSKSFAVTVLFLFFY